MESLIGLFLLTLIAGTLLIALPQLKKADDNLDKWLQMRQVHYVERIKKLEKQGENETAKRARGLFLN